MVDQSKNESEFMTYLASKVSPAQLSELYWCYAQIESFCQKSKVLNGDLFVTTDTDTVKKIQRTVEQNKIFRIKYKKQFAKMLAAWQHYYTFVKEGLFSVAEVAASENTNDVPPAKPENGLANQGDEIEVLLYGDEFDLLRKALVCQKITTLDALKELKLWPFMNRYNLYSIGMRQTVLAKVNALLYPVADLDDSQMFILRVGTETYKGTTPSDAFLQLCDDMLSRYPLQFRLLVGTKMRDGVTVPIRKVEDGTRLLKMTNLAAYISADISKDEVIRFAGWIRNKCGEKPVEITLSEPMQTAPVAESAPISEPEPTPASEPKPAPELAPRPEPMRPKSVILLVSKIEKYVLKADMDGVSYEDVKGAMNITMVATRQYVSETIHIVDINGKLIHEDAFVDWEDGADHLEEIIDKLMQKNSGYISSAQLYEYARADMNMFLNDNDMNEERAVYDMARHLFEKECYHGKRFNFYGNTHISHIDDVITTNLDVIKKYAGGQGGVFSLTALGEYLDSIGISSANLRAQMRIPYEPMFFYYEEGILMFADNMHIDSAWEVAVKTALDALLADVGGYIILRNVPTIWFERLPMLPGRRPWTPLLLQSILRCFSKKLGARTIPAMDGQAIETLHAMLVKNDSPIQVFGDVIVSYLVDNEIEQRDFEAEELRKMLVDAGILCGNELIWNMPKALKNDERFAWDASGSNVCVEV